MEQHPDESPRAGEPAPNAADEAAFDPASLPLPWDGPDPEGAEDDPGAPRLRHDAFTEARKAEFLTALVKTGCILDACRAIGVAPRTVYRHQEGDPRFFDHCTAALRMSATPIELTAWQRAVEGVEQEFACGGQVHVRRRYDSGLLRLLLQGSNPKKYGPRPGFSRKRILKHEKKEMEREIRAQIAAKRPSFEDSIELLDRQLVALGVRDERKKLGEGWTRTDDGHWIPPGYGRIAPPEAPEDAADAAPPAESMFACRLRHLSALAQWPGTSNFSR
jgi:hypothetical protein